MQKELMKNKTYSDAINEYVKKYYEKDLYNLKELYKKQQLTENHIIYLKEFFRNIYNMKLSKDFGEIKCIIDYDKADIPDMSDYNIPDDIDVTFVIDVQRNDSAYSYIVVNPHFQVSHFSFNILNEKYNLPVEEFGVLIDFNSEYKKVKKPSSPKMIVKDEWVSTCDILYISSNSLKSNYIRKKEYVEKKMHMDPIWYSKNLNTHLVDYMFDCNMIVLSSSDSKIRVGCMLSKSELSCFNSHSYDMMYSEEDIIRSSLCMLPWKGKDACPLCNTQLGDFIDMPPSWIANLSKYIIYNYYEKRQKRTTKFVQKSPKDDTPSGIVIQDKDEQTSTKDRFISYEEWCKRPNVRYYQSLEPSESSKQHTTHASPREHYRNGTWCTSKNGKRFYRNGSTVNKGKGTIIKEIEGSSEKDSKK